MNAIHVIILIEFEKMVGCQMWNSGLTSGYPEGGCETQAIPHRLNYKHVELFFPKFP